MNKELAFYGGSFDPLHVGHYEALEVLSSTFKKVIVVLCENYLKDTPVLDYSFRIDMLNIIANDFPNVIILDLKDEVDIRSTYEVVYYLEKITKKRPTIAFGADCLHSIEKWHNFDLLKNNHEFFIFRRGSSWKEVGLNYNISSIDIDLISSTSIKTEKLYNKIPVKIRDLVIQKMETK